MNNLEQLKTFEDACKVEGLNADQVIPDFTCYPEKYRKYMEAHSKLVIVVRAANRLANKGNEWTPNWNNSNERKYYPWFEMGSSGFRYGVCGAWGTGSSVGSRLCFLNRQTAEYVGEQFIDLYNEYLM